MQQLQSCDVTLCLPSPGCILGWGSVVQLVSCGENSGIAKCCQPYWPSFSAMHKTAAITSFPSH